MANAPALTMRRDWARPQAADLKKLAGTPTGYVVDALGRSGALDQGIRRVFECAPFIGSALPVGTTARDNLAPYAALKVAKPGDVMMIATGDFLGASVIGDLIIGMMRNCGIVAAVTDGLVRDVPGIRDVGIPVYARGVSPNSPFKNGPGAVGYPLTLGGVVVSPGDIVVGDGDGVAVIPAGRLGEVLSALEGIRKKEAQMESAIKDGLTTPPWLEEALATLGVHWT
jgi:4-hydroxy-4-methyl-2-oxoglutarate aldolase